MRGLHPQGFSLWHSRIFSQVPTHNNNINDNDNKCNRTLIVGPSFCGKTHLLLNKIRLIRLEDPEKQIRIITRNPEQYEDAELRTDIYGASQGAL